MEEKKERKMRDSGIPWIGEVPEGWESSKIKYHCTMKSGDNITALDISDNDEYPVYGGNGLRGFYKIYNKNGNHILIGRQGALAGNVHLVNGKFWATDHAVIVTLKNDVFINYFFRMLESMNLNQYAFDTAAQPGLSVSRIMNLNIVLPNLKEQHRIADFLDSKCSEIDALIENLRTRMESAKEYKKAVITEAVTKGLDKDANNESWITSKIKYHCTMKSGDNITALDISDNGEYPVYGGNGLRGFYKTYNKNGNHILIGRQGALAGNVHLVSGKFWATDHAVVVTLKNDVFINYFFRMLDSMNLNQYTFDTAAQPGLSVSRIMNLNIALPSLEEQHRIADYLDSKCSEIDALLQNYEDQIATLEEYKKSLIYEYVTGKKEVPET